MALPILRQRCGRLVSSLHTQLTICVASAALLHPSCEPWTSAIQLSGTGWKSLGNKIRIFTPMGADRPLRPGSRLIALPRRPSFALLLPSTQQGGMPPPPQQHARKYAGNAAVVAPEADTDGVAMSAAKRQRVDARVRTPSRALSPGTLADSAHRSSS